MEPVSGETIDWYLCLDGPNPKILCLLTFSLSVEYFCWRHPVYVVTNQASCNVASSIDYRDIKFADGDYVVCRELEPITTKLIFFREVQKTSRLLFNALGIYIRRRNFFGRLTDRSPRVDSNFETFAPKWREIVDVTRLRYTCRYDHRDCRSSTADHQPPPVWRDSCLVGSRLSTGTVDADNVHFHGRLRPESLIPRGDFAPLYSTLCTLPQSFLFFRLFACR